MQARRALLWPEWGDPGSGIPDPAKTEGEEASDELGDGDYRLLVGAQGKPRGLAAAEVPGPALRPPRHAGGSTSGIRV